MPHHSLWFTAKLASSTCRHEPLCPMVGKLDLSGLIHPPEVPGRLPARNLRMHSSGVRFSALHRRITMNWDQIKGNWKQLTGKVKEQWGKLTDDDLVKIAGKRDQLAGLLQERYGIEKEKAEAEITRFERLLKV